jgi:2-keto-4-pentenoate hydratase/2-oxohepta-3-ene-1,7-dioic acid hydratase in catechol pathway
MKIAFVDEFELVVVDDDRVIPIGHLLADDSGSPQNRLERLITDFDALRPKLEAAAQGGGGKSLSQVRLRAPVPRPAQFLCAMVNYKEELGPNARAFDTSDADFFLKSPLTIVDPGDIVEHPAVDARVFHYEPELAIVIGRPGHDISASEARSHIFGYTIVIDASARGVGNAFYKQKSQRTFGPVSPWIVTADEIPDPQHLQIRLSVNGQARQDFNTDTMLHPIDRLVEVAAATAGIETGDLIATGTCHEGLGPIEDGDVVTTEIEGIGSLTVTASDPQHRHW